MSDVDCATSLDCDLEQYCTSNYECVAGCNEDEDCFAGDSCNVDSKECESYGCRDTTLDCAIGEFCNPMTAECFQIHRGHCQSYCSWNDLVYGATGYECVNFDMGSGSCSTDINGNQSGCSGGPYVIQMMSMIQRFSLGDRHKGRVSTFIAPSIVIRHRHKNSVQIALCVHHCSTQMGLKQNQCVWVTVSTLKTTVLFNKLFSV